MNAKENPSKAIRKRCTLTELLQGVTMKSLKQLHQQTKMAREGKSIPKLLQDAKWQRVEFEMDLQLLAPSRA